MATLIFLYQPGCASCAGMEPLIEKAEQRGDVTVIRRNVNLNADVLGWQPKGTPGFALIDRGELARTATGAMNAKELSQFLDLSYEAAPKRRKKKVAAPSTPMKEAKEEEEEEDVN